MAAERIPGRRLVDLSHPIEAGMTTYPGLPAPIITPVLTREASRDRYAPGTEFAIDRIDLCGNTGTYLDSPFHRYAHGTDLAGLPLERLADLPGIRIELTGTLNRRSIAMRCWPTSWRGTRCCCTPAGIATGGPMPTARLTIHSSPPMPSTSWWRPALRSSASTA